MSGQRYPSLLSVLCLFLVISLSACGKAASSLKYTPPSTADEDGEILYSAEEFKKYGALQREFRAKLTEDEDDQAEDMRFGKDEMDEDDVKQKLEKASVADDLSLLSDEDEELDLDLEVDLGVSLDDYLTQSMQSPETREDKTEEVTDVHALSSAFKDAPPPENTFPIETTGYISSEMGYRIEKQSTENPRYPGFGKDPGLVKWRQTVDLRMQYQYKNGGRSVAEVRGFVDNAYDLKGKENFDPDVLKAYSQELDVNEFWKGGSFYDFADLSIGRQIVVWGTADATAVTDIINPRDYREFFLTPVTEARLPVTMAKMDLYPSTDSSVTLILIGELRFNKMAPPGADFSVIPRELVESDLIYFKGEEFPDQKFQNWEMGGRYKQDIPNGSVSLVAAQVYDDMPHLEYDGVVKDPRGVQKHSFALRHERVEIAGFAASYVSGSFVYKLESAYTRGQRKLLKPDVILERIALTIPGYNPEVSVKKGNIGTSLGFDYTGFANTQVLFEMSSQYIWNYDNTLASSQRADQFILTFNRSVMRETMNLGYFLVFSGANGNFHRVQAAYRLKDNLELKIGVAIYDIAKDQGVFFNIREQDRAFAILKYSY
ncbi:MAG: hypothetical protein HQM11_11905 [SAR324 cluster bacterium]|nr:hypothetical protein [SAR324 cluster bacterium]